MQDTVIDYRQNALGTETYRELCEQYVLAKNYNA